MISDIEIENQRLQAELTQLRQDYQNLAIDGDRLRQSIVEISPETSALFKAQQDLQNERERADRERAKLLSAIAQVANRLLQSPDYTTVLPDVLRLLGEAAGSDRCALTQDVIHPELHVPAVQILMEWCRDGVTESIGSTPDLATALPWDNLAQFRQNNLQGATSNFLIDDLPEPARSKLLGQGLASILVVPIMVQGESWGQIGFDNCGESRLYDEAEIATLRIAADSIAAAIERQQKDAELRKSEALYRSLFEISNEGIYRWELDYPIPLDLPAEAALEHVYQHLYLTQGNDACARMYGLSSSEDFKSLYLKDVHVSSSAKNLDFIRDWIANNYSIRNAESEEIDTKGEQRYFLNSVISFTENEHIIGGWGTQIDVTELRTAQQKLLQAEQARVAQLEDYNQQLRSREHCLEATALAANALVSYPTLEAGLNEALRTIGETVGCDRAVIIQHIDREVGTGFARGLHEWNSQYALPQLATEHIDFPWSAMGIEDWLIQGRAGEVSGGVLAELPEPFRSIQAELDVQATYTVPIFVAGQFWGILGIDYCCEPKRLIAAELGIFKTIASCIGSAIERQRTQAAILQAEQERSQELERLNTELQRSLDRLSESEERYRTLFEISSEGIYRFEFDQPIPINLPIDEQVALVYDRFFIAEGNKTYREMYGFENKEEFNGLRLRDAHVRDSKQNQNFMSATVKNGYQIRNYESEEVDRYGNPCYFLNNVSTTIKDGEAIGGWASQLDITELRLTQQSLLATEQQRVAELAKTNQALKNSLDRLAADPDLNSFLGHVILEIIQQLNLYTAWVELYDPATQTLQMHLLVERGILYSKPHLPEMGDLTASYVASNDTGWNVLNQTKQPLVISLDTIPQFFSTDVAHLLRQWGEQFGIQCGINILLMLGDEPLGVLVLFSTERTTFTQEELELSQALAQQATLAIAIARLAEESRQLAIIRDRNHLAREIHDTLAQGYAGILMQIQAAHFLREQPDQAKHHLDCASHLARESIADARRSVWLLQQDSHAYSDVSGIICQLVEQMGIGATPKPTVEIIGTPCQIAPDLGMHLLRITQESLNNVLRHARSNTVRVQIDYAQQQLQITIEDDGCGFETARRTSGFGLSGMQQRADIIGARLQIQSQPDRGTQIILSLPLVT
jgi:signal transduction histidine kinase/PAS domain-containing protein